MQPRLIRLKDAPKYLGMDRHRFNKEVRPMVTNIPIGKQGLAFDRFELDSWVDNYIKDLASYNDGQQCRKRKACGQKGKLGHSYHSKPALENDFKKVVKAIIQGHGK